MQAGTPFIRTFSQLLADRSGYRIAAACSGLSVLLIWTWWASAADVALYAVSTAARVEFESSRYPVQSPLSGRVITTYLQPGQAQSVRKGDVLFELDATRQELQLREQQARAVAIELEIEGARRQLRAEELTRAEEYSVAGLSSAEADANLRAARADARYADSEHARAESLHQQRLFTQQELERTGLQAERSAARVERLAAAGRRITHEQAMRVLERDIRIEQLHRDLAVHEAERSTFHASIERLRHEIEQRRVRAANDGVIAESVRLQPGSVVQEGAHLASILGPGKLVVGAQFPAHAVYGRIRPGQAGRLRLDGFPWFEFGSVSATVSHVARELRDGTVRVELAIDPRSDFLGRLDHGMPGSLEIAVEHVSPFGLLLRTLGQKLTAPQ